MPLTPATDEPGPYSDSGNDSEWGERHAAVLQRIMATDFSVIPAQYDRAYHLSVPSGKELHGWAAADKFWVGLRGALLVRLFVFNIKSGVLRSGYCHWKQKQASRIDDVYDVAASPKVARQNISAVRSVITTGSSGKSTFLSPLQYD